MEFESWNSYDMFRAQCTYRFRYFRDERTDKFLDTVLATSEKRRKVLPEGSVFWRSQLGATTRQHLQDGESYDVPAPYGKDRMKPLRFEAREGRINPKGIPCLYIATDKETSMAEARPWVGQHISAATFKTTRSLTIIDCSLFHDSKWDLYIDEPPREEREKAVWASIDRAFSEPTSSTESTAHYAATQLLAELFRKNGCDGVVYKSRLGPGFNIALFDLDAADYVRSYLFELKKLDFTFRQDEF